MYNRFSIVCTFWCCYSFLLQQQVACAAQLEEERSRTETRIQEALAKQVEIHREQTKETLEAEREKQADVLARTVQV